MKGGLEIHELSCCALAQLTGGDRDSLGSLRRLLDGMTREAGYQWNPDIRGGQRSVFAVSVHPWEPRWEENLKALGFEEKFRFPRRNGYNPEAELIFWLKILIPKGEAPGEKPNNG